MSQFLQLQYLELNYSRKLDSTSVCLFRAGGNEKTSIEHTDGMQVGQALFNFHYIDNLIGVKSIFYGLGSDSKGCLEF